MRVRTPPAALRRQVGAGPKYALVFTDRLLVTRVHLRTGLTHEALGVIYQVGSSTIDRAIGEITLPAERGFAVPQRPGLRLHTVHRRHRNPGPSAVGRTPRTGRIHDQTAMRAEGSAEQSPFHPRVKGMGVHRALPADRHVRPVPRGGALTVQDGRQWREMPAEFGAWPIVHNRFR